jgi:hypothetical protein
MKNTLLDIDAILSHVTAELSMPQPKCEKAREDVDAARDMLLELAENLSEGTALFEAKRRLALVYLAVPEKQFSDSDAEIFSLLSKEHGLQAELERLRKNN